MNAFDLVQYGYLGLLAIMLFHGSAIIKTYLTITTVPPKGSVIIIALYFLFAVVGGAAGYAWAGKELENARTLQTNAKRAQEEIVKARGRLTAVINPLLEARLKSIEQSVYGGNIQERKDLYRLQAKDLTEMIEMQEARFEEEMARIKDLFTSLDAQ